MARPTSPSFISTQNRMGGGNFVMSDSFSVQGPGLTGSYRADYDIPATSEVLLRSANQWQPAPMFPGSLDPGHYLYRPSANPPSLSFHETPRYLFKNKNAEGVYAPFRFPSVQPTTTSLPHQIVSPVSTGHRGPDPPSRLVTPQDSSRHRRGARAIEYNGLWIDEEELIRGIMEPNGKISVLKCFWEGNGSPCHLWITGDKSCIHAHLQKWHGFKPGGDKHSAKCCWPLCGMTMLRESIARHVLGTHFNQVWECQGCGKEIVRNDSYERHVLKSPFEGCSTKGARVTYTTDVRVVDAHAALQGEGRYLYARL